MTTLHGTMRFGRSRIERKRELGKGGDSGSDYNCLTYTDRNMEPCANVRDMLLQVDCLKS